MKVCFRELKEKKKITRKRGKKIFFPLLQILHSSASYQEPLKGLSKWGRDSFISVLLLPQPRSDLGQVIYLVCTSVFPSTERGNWILPYRGMLWSCSILRLTGADLIKGEDTSPWGRHSSLVHFPELFLYSAFYKQDQKDLIKKKNKWKNER